MKKSFQVLGMTLLIWSCTKTAPNGMNWQLQAFQNVLDQAGDKTVFVEFYTDW